MREFKATEARKTTGMVTSRLREEELSGTHSSRKRELELRSLENSEYEIFTNDFKNLIQSGGNENLIQWGNELKRREKFKGTERITGEETSFSDHLKSSGPKWRESIFRAS